MVRVFSEGVPIAATDAEVRMIRNLGGESDSASRQIARYVAEVSRTYQTAVKPLLEFRLDRYLRGGDHISFNEQGYAAVRFTEYREDYHRQHQNVRTENGIEYGDVPRWVNSDYVAERGANKCRGTSFPGVGASTANQGSTANQRVGE